MIVRRISIILLLLLPSCSAQLGPCYEGAVKRLPNQTRFYIDASAVQFRQQIVAAYDEWNSVNSDLRFMDVERGPEIRNGVRAAPEFDRVFIEADNLLGDRDWAAITRSVQPRESEAVVYRVTTLNLSVGLSTNTPPTGTDTQTVMVHEFGHWIGFRNAPINLLTCNGTTVMWENLQPGEIRRQITPQDREALLILY